MQVSDELLSSFISEAWESIDKLDLGIVQLEKNSQDENNIANIFRAVHTIKGSSGFFALKRIEKLTHAAETLLGNIRSGQTSVDLRKIKALLSFNDLLRLQIDYLEKHKEESALDDQLLIEQLIDLSKTGHTGGTVEPEVITASTPEQATVTEQTVRAVTPDQPILIANEPPAASNTDIRTSDYLAPVKVSIELLDTLMNNVSELVLARNRLMPFAEKFSDKNFLNTVAVIDKLTIDLQEKIIKTRMQPIGQLWKKIPRLARDVSEQCNKQVDIFFHGEDTELDRTLLDAVKDPIMHIVRNCIDHGIEHPVQRLANNKPETGKIELKAFHENGMVVIEIKDDGEGIDFDLIRAKAYEKNLLSELDFDKVSEEDLIQILFIPGFSTRSEVTNVSGRGVGMDVVKTNISNIGGSIQINSVRNQGMSCIVKVPLTLAIIPSLLVKVGLEYYSIPQLNLLELVRYDAALNRQNLEEFSGITVLRIRDKIIPLVDLSSLTGSKPVEYNSAAHLNVAIIQTISGQYGLVFEEVIKLQEVVIKPIPKILHWDSIFSGATILGSGQVSLILDVDKIALKARISIHSKHEKIKAASAEVVNTGRSDNAKMLLVDINNFGLSAIPINYVHRMDKINTSRIVKSAGHDVLPYESMVLKLIDLSSVLLTDGQTKSANIYQENVNLVIYYSSIGPFGLVVNLIDKIADLPKEPAKSTPYQFGLLGITLIGGQVVNLLNMPEILQLHGELKQEILPALFV